MNSRRDCQTSVINPIQEVSLSMNEMYTCLLESPYPLGILGEEDYPSVFRVVFPAKDYSCWSHPVSTLLPSGGSLVNCTYCIRYINQLNYQSLTTSAQLVIVFYKNKPDYSSSFQAVFLVSIPLCHGQLIPETCINYQFYV